MAEGFASDTLDEKLKKSYLKAIESGSNDDELEESIKRLQGNERSLTEIFREGGVRALSSNTQERLRGWTSEPVNIAVIGRTGVGKSTFINAVRGDLKPGSPFYAPVGHVQTTMKATPYQHPNQKLLIFWDLPGAGTMTFPRKTYLTDNRIQFKLYDIFIIMSTERFTEDEQWIAEEIRNIGKIYLFVRTKLDVEIDSDRKRNGSKANAANVVDEIRKSCHANLKQIDSEFKEDLYLIASLEIDNKLLDFEKLCIRLVHGLPELKADALLFSLNIMAPAILEAKVESLKKRIWVMGILSASSGAVPVPGVGLPADVALILRETRFYRKQLGVTKADLEIVANIMNIPVDKLAEKYNLTSFALTLSSKGMIGMTTLIVSELIESAIGLAIPVIGSIAGAGVSFATTVKILRAILDIMTADAQKVLELLFQHTAKSTRFLCAVDRDND